LNPLIRKESNHEGADRLLICAAAIVLPGCLFVPKTELTASLIENRSLAEQNRVQLAEIENLQAHSRALEDRVIHGEKQLALAQERASLDRKRLEGYESERDGLYQQFKDLSYGGGRLPPSLAVSWPICRGDSPACSSMPRPASASSTVTFSSTAARPN